MRPNSTILRSERGAIFIQVALVIFALVAMNVFIVDYGVLWTARSQAQAAADAAALAGATARAHDWTFLGDPGVRDVAEQVANLNPIWGAAGASSVDLSNSNCPPNANCVKVAVARDAGGNPLPRYFAPMLGISSHGIRAFATATVGPANATTCLKPWALPDKWLEGGGTVIGQDALVDFNGWGGGPDLYVRPDANQATSASNYSRDYGDRISFRFKYQPEFTNPGNPIALQTMLPLSLTGGHEDSMRACNGQPIHIGQRIPLDLLLTSTTAETVAQEVYDADGGSDWASEGNNHIAYVRDSCAPTCAPISPRTWAVVLFDPLDFQRNRATGWPDCDSAAPCVLVSNIAGFFIDYLEAPPTPLPGVQHGHLVRYPGIYDQNYATIVEDGSWLVQPRLIR